MSPSVHTPYTETVPYLWLQIYRSKSSPLYVHTRYRKSDKQTSECLQFEPLQPIYRSEYLTKCTKKILFQAKSLQKEGIVKFVWTKESLVCIREDDNSKAVKVANDMEMNQIFESFRKVLLDGTESEKTLSASSTRDQTIDNVGTYRKKGSKEQCSPSNNSNPAKANKKSRK